ncbi:hypothetical protein GQ53DRAFT_590501, partial [Thozetella sp. PMI_491]
MWLLEGEAFEGRKLWLRPGKTYLFGRTEAEPGQLTISHKTISRKHLTVQVESVVEGDGRNLHTRSRICIEDLNTKKGTLLNGAQIRGGEKYVLVGDSNDIKMGSCPQVFKITWCPVVLSFSFTAKELRADPWSKLRDQLEQLDIKYSSEYEQGRTSHVVTKKRNTSKGLQALIYGSYIVAESFISAVVEAAALPEGAPDGTTSSLEADFQLNWPDALEHLPPRGEEPSDRPAAAYAPNERRQEVFEGYTFIFYEKKQFDNLFPVITSGKGKALLKEVVPHETPVHDFVRYVKGVAGEKGLGSFEDGSEGRGVVVVRYIPGPKGTDIEWFVEFLNTFAQRLDHRPIDQREFLEAILGCDASILRRPLEEDTEAPATSAAVAQTDSHMQVDPPQEPQVSKPPAEKETSAAQRRRGRAKKGGESRFKGFTIDSDDEEQPIIEDRPAAPQTALDSGEGAHEAAATQDSLFVSQNPDYVEEIPGEEGIVRPRHSLRKRPYHDASAFLDEMAPTAAAVKRQRIEAGLDPVAAISSRPEPELADEEMVSDSPEGKTGKGKSSTKDQGKSAKGRAKRDTLDPKEILELARQRREEAEAKAAAEHKALVELPEDGIDYAAIRRMHIIEDIEVHYPDTQANGRNREQDIADGRWDPRWNGRKNFKKFRKHGDPAGRPAPRIVIALEEAKPKGYGIGDDYWLEGEEGSQKETQSQPESQSQSRSRSQAQPSTAKGKAPGPARPTLRLDSSDDDVDDRTEEILEESLPEIEPSRTRAGKVAEKANALRSQSQVESQTRSAASRASGKRTATAPP